MHDVVLSIAIPLGQVSNSANNLLTSLISVIKLNPDYLFTLEQ